MCGIVAGVSTRNIVPILVEGLKRLEYRGYDSCGVAVHQDGALRRTRSTARVAELQAQIAADHVQSGTGIAHTRWATHGAPAVHNAHPHFSPARLGPEAATSDPADAASRGARIALVHNGIIENHDELRAELKAKGFHFESQTDTEVIAHLVNHLYDGDLFDAVQRAVPRLKGAYAIAVFCRDEPHRVIGARAGSPLVLGIGTSRAPRTSSPPTRWRWPASPTRSSTWKKATSSTCSSASTGSAPADANGSLKPVQREVRTVHAHTGAAELGPYRHYMQKEIFEQPRAIGDTLDGINGITPELFGDGAYRAFKDVDQVLILACGTSYYAGSVASYWLESIARIPTSIEVASEYRYRDSVPNPRTLVVTISQSGETADTLSALKHARTLGMTHTLTICNVQTSAMVRECKFNLITRAGAEIGVASTKAFTTQLVGLFLLTLALAQVRGHLDDAHRGRPPQGPAPPARRGAGRARARAADHGLERGVRHQGKRPLPRPRPALPDRPRRRAQAQGDQLHPRRGLPRRRTQARPARAGDRRNAGGHRRPERRAAGEAQEQHAGSARARRRTVRLRRRRLPHRERRGPARDPHARALRRAVADPARRAAAAAGVSHGVARGTDVDKPRNLAKSVTVE